MKRWVRWRDENCQKEEYMTNHHIWIYGFFKSTNKMKSRRKNEIVDKSGQKDDEMTKGWKDDAWLNIDMCNCSDMDNPTYHTITIIIGWWRDWIWMEFWQVPPNSTMYHL